MDCLVSEKSIINATSGTSVTGARGTTISSAKYSFEAIGRWKE